MREYLQKLLNEKRDLQLRLNKYNDIIDAYFGTPEYFKLKNIYYDRTKELQDKIRQLKKKIDFITNLKNKMGR